MQSDPRPCDRPVPRHAAPLRPKQLDLRVDARRADGRAVQSFYPSTRILAMP